MVQPRAGSRRPRRARRRTAAVHVIAVRVATALSRLLPIRPRVVLATAHATRIGGNLAAIRDAMIERGGVPRPVEVAYRRRPGTRGFLRTLSAEIVAAHYVATSRLVVVDDHFFPLRVAGRRRGTTVVQTWHACGALKRFGRSLGDAGEGEPKPDTRRRAGTGSPYSALLASSRLAAGFYAEAFGEPVEKFVWDVGIPRTDALVRDRSDVARAMRARLGIPDDRRAILYAPTFRGEPGRSARAPDDLDLTALSAELGKTHVVLRRMHPHVGIGGGPGAGNLGGFVIDVSRYADVNELLLVADALITDYSSVLFEFALLERPIALFAPDLEEYERERGFYIDYRNEGPAPVFATTAEVAGYFRRGEFDLGRVRRFRDRWFEVADGRSTERFLDRFVVPAVVREPIDETRAGGVQEA